MALSFAFCWPKHTCEEVCSSDEEVSDVVVGPVLGPSLGAVDSSDSSGCQGPELGGTISELTMEASVGSAAARRGLAVHLCNTLGGVERVMNSSTRTASMQGRILHVVGF